MPTQEALEAGFPLFARHRALLPALLAWRLGRALTTGRARAASELKALASLGRDGWA